MWDEFEHLYNTLFTNSESYIKIVEALSSKRGGLTRAEVVEQTKLNGNGDLTAVLQFIKNNYGKDEQCWRIQQIILPVALGKVLSLNKFARIMYLL